MKEDIMERICPLLAIGWMSNKWSARSNQGDHSSTWDTPNLPKCKEKECQFWSSKEQDCRLLPPEEVDNG